MAVQQTSPANPYTIKAELIHDICNWKLEKEHVTDMCIHFISFIAKILLQIEKGRQFLLNVLKLRGLDHISRFILYILLLHEKIDTKTLAMIIWNFLISSLEERKQNNPNNSEPQLFRDVGGLSFDLVRFYPMSARSINKRLCECALTLEDEKYVNLSAEFLCYCVGSEQIDRKLVVDYITKVKDKIKHPCSDLLSYMLIEETYTSFSEVLKAYKAIILVDDKIKSNKIVYDIRKANKFHTAIRTHKLYDRENKEQMKEYIPYIAKYIPEKSILEKIIDDIKDPDWYKGYICLSFTLHIYFPERDPFINVNAMYRTKYSNQRYMRDLFMMKMSTISSREYEWAAPFLLKFTIEGIKACNTETARENWYRIEKILEKYKDVVKLKQLSSWLAKSHTCRDCDRKLVAIYELYNKKT